jgi:hypothetical protein
MVTVANCVLLPVLHVCDVLHVCVACTQQRNAPLPGGQSPLHHFGRRLGGPEVKHIRVPQQFRYVNVTTLTCYLLLHGSSNITNFSFSDTLHCTTLQHSCMITMYCEIQSKHEQQCVAVAY